MEALLTLENISFTYEGGQNALSDISASIYPGEKIAVLGSNGAGKSTFFLCCNGVRSPQKGRILLHGEEIGKDKSARNRLRRAVGLVFQDPDAQMLGGTVEEEISFGPMNLRLPMDEVERRVEETMARFGLTSLHHRAPHTLSGGEKKRVTLADVLAMEPTLLLLDEPTASLDQEGVARLEESLAMLSQRGLALLIATHDVDFAWRWADRILLFEKGRIAGDGAVETLFKDEKLLARCGLGMPMLMRVGQALKLSPLPRSIGELERMTAL